MTLEYGMFNSEHPTLEFITPLVFRLVYILTTLMRYKRKFVFFNYLQTDSLFRQRYKEGTLPIFDIIISYSSLEHSGLGKFSKKQSDVRFAREITNL